MTLFRAHRHARPGHGNQSVAEENLGRYFYESLLLGNTSSAPNTRNNYH